jgi:nucleoid-associated protein YgaU
MKQVTIKRTDGSMTDVTAQYNPAEVTFAKSVQYAEIAIPGLDSPILQFGRGQTETLAFDLFFDTTDDGTAVTVKTDAFYELVKIDGNTHAPPVVTFSWPAEGFPGAKLSAPWDHQSRSLFTCVVDSVRQRFTLFDENGTPLRAVLSISAREYKTIDDQIDKIQFKSADHSKAHVVQQGDTITRIAGSAYEDPSAWRAIADHNGLDDPFDLRPGHVLELPPIA